MSSSSTLIYGFFAEILFSLVGMQASFAEMYSSCVEISSAFVEFKGSFAEI